MSAKALATLIVKHSADEVVDRLLAMPDDERRALAPHAADLYKEVDGGRVLNEWLALVPGVASTTRNGSWNNTWREQREKLALAVLTVCNIDKAKRVRWLRLTDPPTIRRVFEAREPAWRNAWLRHRLEDEFPGLSWEFVRGMVRDGACSRPESDGYVRLMVQDLNRWSGEAYVPLSTKLLADSGLLENEVWWLFETDTTAFDDAWMRNNPKRPANYESWSDAFVKLAGSGDLDRQRLLDATLSGLWKRTSSGVLSGYHNLHSALGPTPEELDAREPQYRDLLGHKTPPVVGFALKFLTQMARRRPLAAAPTLAAMGSLFALQAKTHPLAALKLIGRLTEQDSTCAANAFPLLLEALRHPGSDVQQAAAALLCKHQASWTNEQLEQLPAIREELSALAREKLDTLISHRPEARSSRSSEETAALQDQDDDVFSRLAALDEHMRKLGGLSDDIDLTQPPPPLAFALTEVPVLTSLQAFTPLASVDELIDGIAHAIESIDSADEVERLVDGIARFFDSRPADFAVRAQPLIKRFLEGARSDARGLVLWGVPNGLRDLVLTWLTGHLHHHGYAFYVHAGGPMRFIDRRLRELTRHLSFKGALQPLATPTHEHGWIDARVLVERLADYEMARRAPLQSDLIQALLRLAPDGRAAALTSALHLRSPWAKALCWALGAEAGPAKSERKRGALWVAAGRALAPQGDLTEALAPLGLEIPWPDVIQPASYEWRAHTRIVRHYQSESSVPSLEVKVSPPDSGSPPQRAWTWGLRAKVREFARLLPGRLQCFATWLRLTPARVTLRTIDLKLSFPTCLPHESARGRFMGVGYSAPWLIEWSQIVWPLNTEAFFAQGARLMVERIDATSSTSEPLHPYLNPLFEANRPWSELAMLMLWTATASRDGDLRRLAADVLIEGIDDGRAHPVSLAGVLQSLDSGGWLKSSRVIETLREVARVSALHQWAIAAIIEAALEVFLRQSSKANLGLELLLELMVDLGRGPTEQTANRLAGITSGKAGVTAKAIRARAFDAPLVRPGEPVRAAWEARIRRVESWSLAHGDALGEESAPAFKGIALETPAPASTRDDSRRGR